jgi:Family of unknown function (DUF5317)
MGRMLGSRVQRRSDHARYRGRMLVYVVAIAVALLIVPLTGGSFDRLIRLNLRRPWLLFAGLALQILLEFVDLPRARYDDVGLAILLASYVLIIGFGLSNLMITGMAVITFGIAMNGFVIALNQGMPYRVPEGVTAETTVKHRPEASDDVLPQLGDYIVLDSPVNTAISFGDLVIAVGLVDLTFRASRRSRRSRARAGRPDDETTDLDPPVPVDTGFRSPPARPQPSYASRPLPSDPDRDVGGGAPRDPLERVEHTRVVDVSGS